MMTRRFSAARITGLVSCAALLAGLVGCGRMAMSPEEAMPLAEHNYRRFSGAGGSGGIFDAARQALDRMGAVITGERRGESLHGKLNVARQQAYIYLKIARGNRVYVTIYNLKKREADEWRLKIYDAIEAAIGGAPSERGRGGRGRRGGRG